MTDDELRAIVREAVARHLDRSSGPETLAAPIGRVHQSHARFPVPSGGDGDGPCLIEPAVHCNHCGYCQSYGH